MDAKNLHARKKHQADNQQNKSSGKEKDLLFCRGCERPCRSKGVLTSHEKNCTELKMGGVASFSKLNPLNPPTTTEEVAEKVVTLSQTLTDNDEELHISTSPTIVKNTISPDSSSTTTNVLPQLEPEHSVSDTTTGDTVDSTDESDPHSRSNSQQQDNCTCPICKSVVTDEACICCNMCSTWVHQSCLHMGEDEFEVLSQPDAVWFCARCRQIKANKVKWGDHTGEDVIREMVQSAYAEIIGWKKNIFRLPRGQCGSDFIKELT